MDSKSRNIVGILAAVAALATVLFVLVKACPAPPRGDAYSYDLGRLRKVDPALLRYEEKSSFAVGLKQPRAMAVDSHGRVLVVGDRALRIFAADGAPAREVAFSGEPTCVAVTADGDLYVGIRDRVGPSDRHVHVLSPAQPDTRLVPDPAGDAHHGDGYVLVQAKRAARHRSSVENGGRRTGQRGVPGGGAGIVSSGNERRSSGHQAVPLGVEETREARCRR